MEVEEPSPPAAAPAVNIIGLGGHHSSNAKKYARQWVDAMDGDDDRCPESLSAWKIRVQGHRGQDEYECDTMAQLLEQGDSEKRGYDYHLDTLIFGSAHDHWMYFTDPEIEVAIYSEEYADAVRAARAAAVAAAEAAMEEEPQPPAAAPAADEAAAAAALAVLAGGAARTDDASEGGGGRGMWSNKRAQLHDEQEDEAVAAAGLEPEGGGR